jgi:hypothetical protein
MRVVEMSPDAPARRRGIVAWLASLPRRLWHEAVDSAEMLSDAGHGPAPWQETSEVDNPYAGWDKGRRAESPFGAEDSPPRRTTGR